MKRVNVTDPCCNYTEDQQQQQQHSTISQNHCVRTVNNSSISSKLSQSISIDNLLLPFGLPSTDLLEPPIEPYFKSVNPVESLANVYKRLESCPSEEKSRVFLEQYSLFKELSKPDLVRRSLRCARQNAVDVNDKVVLSAWLRYERREDEFDGSCSMDCGSGRVIECPKSSLVSGYDPDLAFEPCPCRRTLVEGLTVDEREEEECSTSERDDYDVSFCIGDEEIRCCRYKIGCLSRPLNTLLYGEFTESKREKISFTHGEISAEGMRAVELFSRTKKSFTVSPRILLEILSFANRFCCEEMKAACDKHLADLVCNIEDALLLIEYGLEGMAYLLVASCLQVFLRELPRSMYNSNIMRLFCGLETRKRLEIMGHASFTLYYFLSLVAMEEDMKSDSTVFLLERLGECATLEWQKGLAFHQLGCVKLERKEYKDAQLWFEAALEVGHVYSLTGVARSKYKRGRKHTAYRSKYKKGRKQTAYRSKYKRGGPKYTAYKQASSLISKHTPLGWMYQERSLYCSGKERMMDLDTATELDPTLPFPYKHRAVALVEENKIEAAILEIDKIINFKVTPDCLELRAWFSIVLEDYEAALRDIRALLTLEPSYMMYRGKVQGNYMVELLCKRVQQWSRTDCGMQLNDRWSSVDNIESLAIVHQMLANEPGSSLLRFWQYLILSRLHFQKTAMRSLRLARNHSSSEHEMLVYEGWILYDTGHREEALAKAEKSISIQRSFEAFFLKAYALADTSLDAESSSYVIQLLEGALKCPSDGTRKGQALYNLGNKYVNCDELDIAADCYANALDIRHTSAHEGLARVYHLKTQRENAYDEMTKLIEKAPNNASAYEKRSEYCDLAMAKSDLTMATQLDPLRTYPYRYRAAILMDNNKETEAIAELTKIILFKPNLRSLYLRAAFFESMGDYVQTVRDCEAALCLDPTHSDTLEVYNRSSDRASDVQQTK
ncbi:hypothetical protein MKW92_025744 [Papaver armeniacum]|nr:hypothetical protein MKW92_025744 [Papaver armeniacum]